MHTEVTGKINAVHLLGEVDAEHKHTHMHTEVTEKIDAAHLLGEVDAEHTQ